MKTIDKIIARKNTDNIITLLDSYGICIVKNYATSKEINELNQEFDKALSNESKGKSIYSKEKHPTNKDGAVARGKTKALSKRFSTTKSLFLSEFIRDISNKYFGNKCIVSNDVFFTHEKASDIPILPWHFDRQQSLKFYINLMDVDQNNGAFEYDLGSHREGHFRANYYILSGVEIGDIPNDIPENELHNPITIAVSAGDLIIFDPDGFHRAGVVSKGKERKVIRSHTHPIPNRNYKAKLFDTHWWLQSPFNLSRLLSSQSDRVLLGKRLTNATKR